MSDAEELRNEADKGETPALPPSHENEPVQTDPITAKNQQTGENEKPSIPDASKESASPTAHETREEKILTEDNNTQSVPKEDGAIVQSTNITDNIKNVVSEGDGPNNQPPQDAEDSAKPIADGPEPNHSFKDAMTTANRLPVEESLKKIYDEAAKKHRDSLNSIFDKGNLGFKDSSIRKYDESLRTWISGGLEKTVGSLKGDENFKEIMNSCTKKLTKTMDTQLLLCFRKQEIMIEKLLMKVKLVTCEAADYFDSLCQSKTRDKTTLEDVQKWSKESLSKFRKALSEQGKSGECLEFELQARFSEMEREISSVVQEQTAAKDADKATMPAKISEEEQTAVVNVEAQKTEKEEPAAVKVEEKTKTDDKVEDKNKTAEKVEGKNKRAEKVEDKNKTAEKVEDKNKTAEKVEEKNKTPEKAEEAKIGVNAKTGTMVNKAIHNLQYPKVNVGIYVDNESLLVGTYTLDKTVDLIERQFLQTVKESELHPSSTTEKPDIRVFQDIFQQNSNESIVDSSHVASTNIQTQVQAFLKAIDKMLRTKQKKAQKVALSVFPDVNPEMKKMINEAGKGFFEEFSLIPYESATILGYCSPKIGENRPLPPREERKTLVETHGTSIVQATTVLISDKGVTRSLPRKIKNEGKEKMAEFLDLQGEAGAAWYVVECGEDTFGQNKIKLDEIRSNIVDKSADPFRGVCVLSTLPSSGFKIQDRQTTI